MSKDPLEKEAAYQSLRTTVSNLYPERLTDKEAFEATRNLIGFAKLLLEIKTQLELESKDAKSE